MTVSVVLYRTSLIEHCGISLEDLKEELSADQGKETTPTLDAEDEVIYVYSCSFAAACSPYLCY